MEAATTILGVTIVLAVITKILQRKLIDKKEMKKFQEESKEIQKELKELMKEAEKNKDKINELQTKMLTNSTSMMNKNMRLSLFTAPLFLVVFWFLSTLYGGQLIESFIALPKFNGFNLLNPFSWVPIGLTIETGYYKAFFFYYMGSAMLMSLIEKVYDYFKKKNKGE
ncbi:MAG: EMC3/TMCO1 family protein [Candidatus ainarchaeum sp.]|nr:EMC3/TMCO1 family protein [Candidatus ainarchaeum sp.]MDD3085751.1 EMC3/TMCO1 family protein [Candidatus ainarchaeum sp.]